MKIREAASSDIQEIDRIINEHWAVNVDHEKELRNPKAVLLVAEDDVDCHIKGMALMWVIEWNKTGYLVELAVGKLMMRKGIGSKLIRTLVERAKQDNLRSIIVETQIGRKEAIDFYMSQGFRMSGYSDRYYTNSPKSSNDIALFFSLDVSF
jgi:N-acetylglutamate synthase-like GNAT family acetyltransferase